MIVGRELEKEELASFLDAVPNGPAALLLVGEPGIGKSVLLNEAVRDAHSLGFTVLGCTPTGSDTELSFVGLGDLLGPGTDPFIVDLPDPQREALELALLRRPRTGRAPDPRAVAVATLRVLLAIAEKNTVIVAVDDVQWIDPATARVLSFAMRRLSEEPVGLLLGRPTTEEPPPLGLDRGVPAERLRLVEVGPLDPHEIAAIVREAGLALSKIDGASLTELADGNPLYALEIARALARGDEGVTGQRMPIPRGLREDLISGRVGDVSTKTRDLLLYGSAMARPSVDALREVVPAQGFDAALQQAIDAGIIRVLGTEVRFAHPLYRSGIYADASRRRRHEVHRRLAESTEDAEERARHRALSVDGPDASTAGEVELAASSARSRGAPEVAAELLEHALRLTPRSDTAAARRRLLLAARDRFAAGDADGGRARAREALRIPDEISERAEPLQLIGEFELARGALIEARVALDEALGSARDTAMEAEIHRDLARVALRSGEMGAAERHADAALELVERLEAPRLNSSVRATAARVDVLLGRSSDLLQKLPEGEPGSGAVADSPELVLAETETLAGRFEPAQERLERLLVQTLGQGDEPGRLLVTTRLAEVQVRRGSWEAAADLAHRAHDLALELGVRDANQLGLMAFAAAGLGRAEEARTLGERGIGAEPADRPALLWNLSALGFLELSLGHATDASRHLGRAGGILAEIGELDPCAFPFLADEIEALLGIGELAVASRRTDELEGSGTRLDRPLVLGQAARCRGLLEAAAGNVAAALPILERAVELHEDTGVPVELGRSLLALGAARRREKQKRPAREVLERALEVLTSPATPLWHERVLDELARIGGRRASTGELTDAEERVARLAAAGLTNREIAQTLFLGVRTVEGHLSHVYAKTGVRSRTELAVLYPGD